MKNRKIVLLGGRGLSTKIVFNSINKGFGIHLAIIEDKEKISKFIKRRIKRLGLINVIGQILFQIIIFKPLSILSKSRKNEIIYNNEFDLTEIPHDKIRNVTSINSKTTIDLLKNINPDLVIVNGTRIISKKVLMSINGKFINTHAGITPKYRGVHGMYWALIHNDIENCGVTVHFVDEGIDTGNIIYQMKVKPTKRDNFSTYPLLQYAEGLKLLDKAINDFFNNKIVVQKEFPKESYLWYHPTIWNYLFYRLIKGIK